MKKLWTSGEPFVWLTGGALAISLLMVAGLIGLILYNGLGFFWPAAVAQVTLKDGKVLTGPDRRPGRYSRAARRAPHQDQGSEPRSLWR